MALVRSTVLRSQRLDPAQLDQATVLNAIREYFRTVRYHLDPKLAELRSVWAKLAPSEPMPSTPMLRIGPHKPKRWR